MTQRVHYIDWLRVLAVLLLFPFHTFRVFNANDPFYVKAAQLSDQVNYFIGFVDRWHMPLLFLLAGASTYFALRKRTGTQYVIERIKRLLVPLVFGILVLVPPQTWLGGQFNSDYGSSYLTYLTSGDFLVFNFGEGGDYYGGFGVAHMWFILFLFVVSLAALPLLLWARTARGTAAFARFARRIAKPMWWLLPAFLILVGEALPDIVGKNPFYYLAFFVLGYAIMCDGSFAESAERFMWPALAVGSALTLWWVLTGRMRDSLPDPSFERAGVTLLGMLAAWLMIVAFLGLGRHYLDRTSPALVYLAPASYPLYIIHQTVIVVLAFYIVKMDAPWVAQWALLFVTTIAGTFGIYEIVRRVPGVRFLFGMR